MDQGGLKRNGNRDDSLTFLEPGVGVGRESVDTAGSLLHANMHLPNNNTAPLQMSQSTVASNGRVAPKNQVNLVNLFESPDICFNIEDNLPVLNHGSTDLDRSSTNIINSSDTSVLRNLPIPDLFGSHIKQEQDFPLHKDIGGYNTPPGSCDLDGTNVRLMEDSEIWQGLDLPGTLPEISDIEVVSEVALLDNILHETASNVGVPMRGMLKETKPLMGNGGHCSGVNGTDPHHASMLHQAQDVPLLHHQPTSLLSSVMIKEEKEDDFIHIQTPGVVKQEKPDNSSYCTNQCLQNSSLHGAPMPPSMGHGYHYRPAPSSTVTLPDQKPFSMYPTLPPVEEGWARGRYGEGSGMQRSENGLPSTSPSLAPYPLNFPSSTSRTGETVSSSGQSQSKSGSTHKICLVCSDEASGCHYGVVTCGSCKVFFKRAVEGQHNYLCAGRNDCIIDKIRRKNCPACRFRKCLQAGMNLEARKNKKLMKRINPPRPSQDHTPHMPVPIIPMGLSQLVPTMLSVLKAIEPEIIYSGYDSTVPDTSSRLMTTLNRLGGQQVISAVKWAKSLPGFRNLHLDDQMTLLQCSWLFLMSFSLGWRSYEQCNGSMLCFAPDLVINKERMKLPFMNEQCEQMLKICNEFVRLQVSYEEYLCMKVLLLLSTVPKDGLKCQAVFDEIRMTYIKELGKAIVKREENSSQNWQRFYQLTKLLDSMQEMVEGLLQICFYTFVNKTLCVEFPEMLAEIISNQIPKLKDGSVKPLLFHSK
ncbi:glucocorticoid receptor-like isoform X2 [Boleophthalmus pectinirostris]|uniref:glucocorticoid receptor-like isoform X2 n=1 Tax=Boleophthalmus pectinirostris TaxID=150288 RepID=UPI00242F3844|nr:glucocorticoid receptor-like isoform X2 [Boleophthalmus pectinirostris]